MLTLQSGRYSAPRRRGFLRSGARVSRYPRRVRWSARPSEKIDVYVFDYLAILRGSHGKDALAPEGAHAVAHLAEPAEMADRAIRSIAESFVDHDRALGDKASLVSVTQVDRLTQPFSQPNRRWIQLGAIVVRSPGSRLVRRRPSEEVPYERYSHYHANADCAQGLPADAKRLQLLVSPADGGAYQHKRDQKRHGPYTEFVISTQLSQRCCTGNDLACCPPHRFPPAASTVPAASTRSRLRR